MAKRRKVKVSKNALPKGVDPPWETILKKWTKMLRRHVVALLKPTMAVCGKVRYRIAGDYVTIRTFGHRWHLHGALVFRLVKGKGSFPAPLVKWARKYRDEAEEWIEKVEQAQLEMGREGKRSRREYFEKKKVARKAVRARARAKVKAKGKPLKAKQHTRRKKRKKAKAS